MESESPSDLNAVVPAAPVDLTSFVGRRDELAEVKRLMSLHRLVTLTGVGGVGKTRIAAQIAHDVRRRFADAVAWVELADLRDASLVAQTVQDRLSIPERVGRDPLTILANHLRSRSLLLVLDNAEHVLPEVAHLVGELLRAAPQVSFLVTSRQALDLPGERQFPVAPLLVPTAEQATAPGAKVVYPSLALFQDRAEAIVPGFTITPANQQAVAAVCRRLDGIPLAIELATTRLRALTVEELAERLEARLDMAGLSKKRPNSRHQTLQATIDWSYELCTPDERVLWARAAVFAGGFSVSAAEAVCSGEGLDGEDILDTLAGLVDKSILIRTELEGRTRFKLLEPLREYGLAELAKRGEVTQALDRHLDWCAELVNEACLQWFGPAQERWCVTMQLEKANVRAAADHALGDPSKVDLALRLLGRPWFLWVALFLDEGKHWLAKALSRAVEPSPASARALATAAYVAALQGDSEAAERFVLRSRSIAEPLGDSATLAYAAHMLGLNMMFRDPETSVEIFEEALALYQRAPDVFDDYISGLRIQLGLALLFSDQVDAAAEQFTLCRDLCTVTGERWLLSYALYGEGFVAFVRGDLVRAIELAREALSIKRFFGDTLGEAVCLDLMAWASAEAGDARDAALLLGGASRLWDSFGVRLFGSAHWLAGRERAIDRATDVLGRSRFESMFAQGEAMSPADALAFALGEKVSPVKEAEATAVSLTRRELEVANLVAEGLSNKAISQRLVIAQRTAECHVENILVKFGFRSRSQIAAWVAENRVTS